MTAKSSPLFCQYSEVRPELEPHYLKVITWLGMFNPISTRNPQQDFENLFVTTNLLQARLTTGMVNYSRPKGAPPICHGWLARTTVDRLSGSPQPARLCRQIKMSVVKMWVAFHHPQTIDLERTSCGEGTSVTRPSYPSLALWPPHDTSCDVINMHQMTFV